MAGETMAVLAAFAYGLAGVAIMKGKPAAHGDNGVFLSVIMTAALSGAVWLGWGTARIEDLNGGPARAALAVFAGAGLVSIVLGRITMYRATERIGAVNTALLRRLTPVFAVPCAFLLLGEQPDRTVLLGGALILTGAYLYLKSMPRQRDALATAGLYLATGSAFFYALSYALRSRGLAILPDAALGAFVGAVAATAWLGFGAILRNGIGSGCRALFKDTGRWQVLAAVCLSAGQILQFFALSSASVAAVAVIGSLDVLFSATIMVGLGMTDTIRMDRLLPALALAAGGTALMLVV